MSMSVLIRTTQVIVPSAFAKGNLRIAHFLPPDALVMPVLWAEFVRPVLLRVLIENART